MKTFYQLSLYIIIAFVNITASFSQCYNIVKQDTIKVSETWTKNNIYLLRGAVVVQAPAELTIEAGTIIQGEKSTSGGLIILPGAKIIANGTASEPIVFTAEAPPGFRDRGDWRGISILGNAKVNAASSPCLEGYSTCYSYGKPNASAFDDTESSGSLTYVRIEFAGVAISVDNETNPLTLAGVGSGTIIDYVQVSHSNDDGFEIFGGTVNAKHLISYVSLDDDFDVDRGYTGNIQFALAVRSPNFADQSGSSGIEADNDSPGSTNLPLTSPVFSNVTIIGPRSDSAKSNADFNINYKHGIHLRRNAAASVFNSVITGFPTGIMIDGTATASNYTNGIGALDENIVAMTHARTTAPVFYKEVNGPATGFTEAYCETTKNNTSVHVVTNPPSSGVWTNLGLSSTVFLKIGSSYPSAPDFSVPSGSMSNGASFADSRLNNPFFASVNYKGAFGATDWTAGWTEWDPRNKEYCLPTNIMESSKAESLFALYPNPSEGIVTIDCLSENSYGNLEITLFNSLGHELLKKNMKSTETIDLKQNGFYKGIYLVKITADNRSEQHKIVIE